MAATNTKPRITVNADVCNGKPVIRGTRVTVETVLGYLGAGDSAETILAQYPQLEPADISACLDFASRLTRTGPVESSSSVCYSFRMTRSQAVATITAKLETADEATVQTVVDLLIAAERPIRDLTPRELALLDQSKADFAAGHTASLDECMTHVDAELARRRAARARQ